MEDSWSRDELAGCNINELELAASTFGLVALAAECGWSNVYSFTDNTPAMAWMRGSSPPSVVAQELSASRVEWMLANNISESVFWIRAPQEIPQVRLGAPVLWQLDDQAYEDREFNADEQTANTVRKVETVS